MVMLSQEAGEVAVEVARHSRGCVDDGDALGRVVLRTKKRACQWILIACRNQLFGTIDFMVDHNATAGAVRDG